MGCDNCELAHVSTPPETLRFTGHAGSAERRYGRGRLPFQREQLQMIASYKRKAGAAAVVFVVSIVTSIALTPTGGNVWENAPLGPILGVIWVVAFYLAFWWYLKAKGRSGTWMLMLLLNLLGLVVISCCSRITARTARARATQGLNRGVAQPETALHAPNFGNRYAGYCRLRGLLGWRAPPPKPPAVPTEAKIIPMPRRH